MCVVAVYCVLWRCNICYGRCTMSYDGVGVLWRYTVCYGSVLCVMAVYSMLWRCTVW